jgi:hypothetical protein
VSQPKDKGERMRAAGFFMTRAQEAMDAAERARSHDAAEALYKEAETWIYMASHCLKPDAARPPQPLSAPPPRAAPERRSFAREE